MVIALKHPPAGITIDAVLPDAAGVSILFSFTRAHSLVDSDHPARLIRFLKTIMPHKPVAELYTSIGYVKHGKTELYRSLVDHTRECSGETFDISRGQPGLVMIAFDLSGLALTYTRVFLCPRCAPPAYSSCRCICGLPGSFT